MNTTIREEIINYIENYNEFDVWECISKCEIDGNLDEIIQSLQEYQKQKSTSLIELINNKFEDLVFLSKTLSEIKEITNDIKYPLKVLEKQINENIKFIKKEIEEIMKELIEEQNLNEKMKKEEQEK